jgi:tyrosine-protein phosphatase SIW14
MQHWSLVSIFEEYRRFSHPKSRAMDQQFIELFDKSRVRTDPRYLPDWAEIENDIYLLPIVGSPVSEPDGE